jgi:hypothetical protein
MDSFTSLNNGSTTLAHSNRGTSHPYHMERRKRHEQGLKV